MVASGAAISVTWGRAWWGRIEVEGRWSVGGLAPGIGLGGDRDGERHGPCPDIRPLTVAGHQIRDESGREQQEKQKARQAYSPSGLA